MNKILQQALLQLAEDMRVGNSNLTEDQEMHLIEVLQEFRDNGMSKYSAYNYLNISRATFDNYVAEGRLPQGKKIIGFKELRWYKKDLDNFINQCKDDNKKKSKSSDI